MMQLLAVTTATSGPASQGVQTAVEHWYDVSRWDATTWTTVILGGVVAILIIVWGGVRFWLVVTRPPKIKDVHTPTLDRMNTEALAHMGEEAEGEEEAEDAPADLLAAVPDEEKPEDKPKPDESSASKPA